MLNIAVDKTHVKRRTNMCSSEKIKKKGIQCSFESYFNNTV